jgi:protein gp37
MSELTSIEWCHHTFNIAWGCIKASAGCDNCYAEVLARRYGYPWGPGAPRRLMSDAYWNQPLSWNHKATLAGERRRVFCSSMTDIFLNDVTIEAQRSRLWDLIEKTPQLDWLLLTKHPERFRSVLPGNLSSRYPNVWLMVSVENNDAQWRAKLLRETDAAIKGLSVEPLLERVDRVSFDGIDWVIIGGESGPHSRPMDLDWALDAAGRATSAGCAVFVKQLGAIASRRLGDGLHRADPKGGDTSRWPQELRIRAYPVNPKFTDAKFMPLGDRFFRQHLIRSTQ